MARGPAHAPTAASWLRDAARLAARAQRLLVFPLGVATIMLVATLPAAIAAGADTSFSSVARYMVAVDERILDGFDGTADIGTTEWAALAFALLVGALAQAWLIGAFIRSLVDRRLVRFPGRATFLRLVLFYVGVLALTVPLGGLVRAGGAWELAYLGGIVALAVPTLLADYAIVIDDLPVRRALVASVRTVRAAPGLALLAFFLAYALGSLVYVLFDQTISDADEVFPPFLVAAALAHGLRAYLTDCALIALYLRARKRDDDEEP